MSKEFVVIRSSQKKRVMSNFIKLAMLLIVFSLVLTLCACKTGGEKVKKTNEIDINGISALVERWIHRDGYQFLELGPQLFEENLSNPNAFYCVMRYNDSAFLDYVRTLPVTCFTNQSDTVTAPLERRRIEAIRVLLEADIDSLYLDMNRVVVDTLMNLKVDYID